MNVILNKNIYKDNKSINLGHSIWPLVNNSGFGGCCWLSI
jgi:hypothetical protein